ncbi:MAG: HAD-IA family hydrolase [Candidatus Binatia bacterium]
MISHHIQAIFFDAAGTLFTVNGSVGAIYANLAREYDKDVSVTDLEAGFRRSFAAAPPMAFPGVAVERTSTLEKQWWRNLVHQVFSTLGAFPRFDDYFEALFEFFARAETWALYPETLATLEQLKRRGFTIGVISNFDSRLLGLLDGLGISPFVDSVVISTRAGAAKPAREIFAQALTHVGVGAESAIHIGDNYEADVVGAQAAGLTPVFVDRRAQGQESTDYLTIGDLSSLLKILE